MNPGDLDLSSRDFQTEPLAARVRERAQRLPDAPAYIFLADGADDERVLTWAALDKRARAIAQVLTECDAHGQRVLLTLPSGLEFIEALFGCWYAGAIAVPLCLPRHRRVKHRLHRVATDAQAAFALGTADARERLDGEGAEKPVTDGLRWIEVNTIADPAGDIAPASDQPIAMLQYTSGSTGEPKGVMVSHDNITHNSAMIARACRHEEGDTIAGWLPLFHDMGLIGLVMQGACVGARCVFMSPERFLMRPWTWLRMIDRYGAVSSPAPNFAYQMCADRVTDEQKAELDLSGWRNALNGSEPVRAATLDRFAEAFASCGFKREAFFPCYGLAEATLFVSGPGEDRSLAYHDTQGGVHVGCGLAHEGLDVSIVDPESHKRVADGQTGEIWISGQSCAGGYWNNAEATEQTFQATLAVDGARWLRTGDLGFFRDGHLFVTSRLRELIIVGGRNHFPVDIERTVGDCDDAISDSSVAAFSVDTDGAERLVVAAEIDRTVARQGVDTDALTMRVRGAIAEVHEVALHLFVPLRPGGLKRTTSGKISRNACRDALLNDTLDRYEDTTHATR